jgi:GNAT superfamily N-acetyltransferase
VSDSPRTDASRQARGVEPAVRAATAADTAAIGRLLDDFNREFDEPTPGAERLARRISQLLGEGDTAVVLVWAPGDAPGDGETSRPASGGGKGIGPGGEPHGLAVLRFRPGLWSEALECYLAELYVIPSLRGGGLGRALMLASISHARERGANYMDLGTGEQDVAARTLYESLGFSNREGKPDGPINYYYEREL